MKEALKRKISKSQLTLKTTKKPHKKIKARVTVPTKVEKVKTTHQLF